MLRFILNETLIATDRPAGTVLLDFIRYQQQLTGTKIGCREGDCGACTVLVGELENGRLRYQSMVSCLMPLRNAHGKHIVTIEGINTPGLNPVQQAMASEGATQCGFCTPGFVVSLTGYCLEENNADKQKAIAAIDGNICRCTGYKSIERAASHITSLLEEQAGRDPIAFAVDKKIVPAYFTKIKSMLESLSSAQVVSKPGNSPGKNNPTFLAGGTDLYVQKHDEIVGLDPEFLFDSPELKKIQLHDNRCIIGAATTVTELKDSTIFQQAFPRLHQYIKLVSSTPIRNMATVGGNFINASPIGDLSIFFLALNAQLVFSDGRRQRELPLKDLYKGYKQLDKRPDEFLQQVWFDLPSPGTLFHFEKVSKRTHLDIASVNTAILLNLEGDVIKDARLAAGGVAPIPLLLQKTSSSLFGKNISLETINEALAVMRTEISPISDARGSKEYKSQLLAQLIKAHFLMLFPSLSEEMFFTHY